MTEKTLQPVRGTHDLIGDAYRNHQRIRDVSFSLASRYGYEPIATPILEHTAVFKRTLGETTDVVGKEMYTFQDRGGDEITLRPEGTAGVVRAVISNGLTQSMPLKLMYSGPMMRYERPQKGRTRQFHHVGVECLGIADPLVDVETIALGAQILEQLGVLHRTTLEINTIGDLPSRNAYRQALVDYFTPFAQSLSPDSQMRLTRNPLRILDSKDVQDQDLIAGAPVFDDYLTSNARDIFDKVCQGLASLGLSYKHNPRLVRGLDYYCHTAFEFTTTDLGAQSAVLAGGRYDGLMAQMGGPDMPAVGWGLGMERVALLLDQPFAPLRPLAVIAVGEEAQTSAFTLAMKLRRDGFIIDLAYSGNMGKRLKRAHKLNACGAILLGADEIAASQATVRNLDTGEQNLVAFAGLKDYLRDHFQQQP